MANQLPEVHVNEGRIMGRFEMPPADMQHITYQGRVVLVLVADANEVLIKDTKEGDTKALWKFTGVDAAIVRDKGLRDHLAKVLYLEGLDPTPLGTIPVRLPGKTMVGVYGEEGEFLGLEAEEEERDAAHYQETKDDVEEWGEVETNPAAFEELPDAAKFATDVEEQPDVEDEIHSEEVFRIESHQPISNEDALLQRFLNEDVSSGV